MKIIYFILRKNHLIVEKNLINEVFIYSLYVSKYNASDKSCIHVYVTIWWSDKYSFILNQIF